MRHGCHCLRFANRRQWGPSTGQRLRSNYFAQQPMATAHSIVRNWQPQQPHNNSIQPLRRAVQLQHSTTNNGRTAPPKQSALNRQRTPRPPALRWRFWLARTTSARILRESCNNLAHESCANLAIILRNIVAQQSFNQARNNIARTSATILRNNIMGSRATILRNNIAQ